MAIEVRKPSEHDDAEICGRVIVAIVRDDTDYGRDPGCSSNIFEKFTVKTRTAPTVHPMDRIRIIGGAAKVWGDYNNNLTVTADTVETLTKPADKIG